MRNFEKKMQEKIEISGEEFSMKAAEVLASGQISELTKANPILMLAFTALVVELEKKIFFNDESNKSNSESEE